MSKIEHINNREKGESARLKINKIVDFIGGIEVRINLTDLNSEYIILEQEANMMFVPTNIICICTNKDGATTTGALLFSTLSGWNVASSFSIYGCFNLLEVTYLVDESYTGRTAIDLNSANWTVVVSQASTATIHEITLLVSGVKTTYTPA